METRSNAQYFHLDQYGLTINPDCYLVTVRDFDEKRLPELIGDLPEWVFYSKHVIWLTEEEKPIGDRARNGEEIRKHLLELRNRRTA